MIRPLKRGSAQHGLGFTNRCDNWRRLAWPSRWWRLEVWGDNPLSGGRYWPSLLPGLVYCCGIGLPIDLTHTGHGLSTHFWRHWEQTSGICGCQLILSRVQLWRSWHCFVTFHPGFGRQGSVHRRNLIHLRLLEGLCAFRFHRFYRIQFYRIQFYRMR